MYSKLHRPIKNKCGTFINAGSCVFLVEYLKKEESKYNTFFSHKDDAVDSTTVINSIDNNKRTLKSKQEKFYMLTYNPSEKEIKFLVKSVTGKKISRWDDLTQLEKEQVLSSFKEYVRDSMNIYAKNFNRDKELTGDDLVYFAKIEENRYEDEKEEYGFLGNKKEAVKRDGFNLHAHVIVSRMDKTQTIALSPRSKNREVSTQLNGKTVKGGFNLMKWKKECEDLYSSKYNYIYDQGERYDSNPMYIAKQRIKGKVKNKIINEMLQDMKEEKQIYKNINKASLIIANPKAAIKSYLKQQIKEILSDNQQTEI